MNHLVCRGWHGAGASCPTSLLLLLNLVLHLGVLGVVLFPFLKVLNSQVMARAVGMGPGVQIILETPPQLSAT